MYEIAEQVQQWLDAGRDVRVGQVVETRGFSSRDPGAAAAWTSDGEQVGRLLEGVSPDALADTGLVRITISETDAVAAGLACGGTASVLVQPASAYPVEVWSRLAARDPLCLVTPIGVDATGPTEVYTPQTIRDAHGYPDAVPRLFARGTTATAVVESGASDLAVVVLWPVPTLAVVGDGLIAAALADVAGVLGWTCRVTPAVDDAVAVIAELRTSDAVVVLSHDRDVDGPTLAAALAGPVGYVGALGSRRTQAARREWLLGHGVPGRDQARIHGPAGLDIDAHTPAEIAVSIVAEIVAERSTSSGGALRDREGPVHRSGVNAPPPRY